MRALGCRIGLAVSFLATSFSLAAPPDEAWTKIAPYFLTTGGVCGEMVRVSFAAEVR